MEYFQVSQHRTVPGDDCPMFVSFAQTVQYLSTMAAPLLGMRLAGRRIGLGGALIAASVLRLAGMALLAVEERTPAE